jgi:SNF2 family DNA or RNA helicase
MLELVETMLRDHGFNYQLITGQTALHNRIKAVSLFNEDPNCTIMLATIGSTGEGYCCCLPHVHIVFD